MPIQWSGLSPELLLVLDRSRPLRVQLENGLRDAIRTGRLPAGERIPSSRELATSLRVSRGLVQECFAQLTAEGYLTAQVGSATRVAQTAAATAAPLPPVRPEPDGPSQPDTATLRADFVPATPDLASFPRNDWARAVRDVLRDAPNEVFGYSDPRGQLRLRTVLAGYLNRVRGAATHPDRLVVCAGFAQGLNLVMRTLVDRGVRLIAVEDPGYDETAVAAASWAGADLVPVPVDDDGLDVNVLDRSGADAVLLTPAHQWPTGVVLAAHRRHALIHWASRRGGWIIEDDYDAEFRYDREPVGVVQGLAPEHVFALGTVSKSLAPTLRLGWILSPPGLVDDLGAQKARNDRGAPGIDQLALAGLIESGRFDRHLRRMRGIYAARRGTLVAALTDHAPQIAITGLAAGFHAIAHLPAHVDESTVIAAARARGIGLYGMSPQRADKLTDPPQLVLGFGNLNERRIREGIAAVADLMRG